MVIRSSVLRLFKFYNYNCIKIKALNLKVFMKKNISKDDTMNENDLQRVFNNRIYPRDSKILTGKSFVNIDNGSLGGTHWTFFIVKDKESYYFDSFGGASDKFLLYQLPKPIIYHSYKIQEINSKLCGSYCLYFFLND